VNSCDYIVVGAGSADCVLANRLSADPNNKVLLLEAGGKDLGPWLHVPVGYFKTMHNPAFDWCYETELDAGTAGRSLQWPRGKVLGGSSSDPLSAGGEAFSELLQGRCPAPKIVLQTG